MVCLHTFTSRLLKLDMPDKKRQPRGKITIRGEGKMPPVLFLTATAALLLYDNLSATAIVCYFQHFRLLFFWVRCFRSHPVITGSCYDLTAVTANVRIKYRSGVRTNKLTSSLSKLDKGTKQYSSFTGR